MRVAYFDCGMGISGNMIFGALLDAGVSKTYLLSELKKLKLNNYTISLSIAHNSTLVTVKVKTPEKQRTLKEIIKIIDGSRLSKEIKDQSKEIFVRLAKAEAKVHGTTIDKLHFHELGATDAIIDIVGAVIGLKKLGIKKVYSSALNVGKGRTKSHHGEFSVPAPATKELLKGVPIFTNNISGELVTPTGAAIITTVCNDFGDMPKIGVRATGSGMGSYKLAVPNIVQLFIGDTDEAFEKDMVLEIDTNIDNMNPEIFDYVIKKLMSAGALDAFITPISMKKGRPASTLTVLSPIKLKDKLTKMVFEETTSLGVRTFLVPRNKLQRKSLKVNTKFGGLSVKVGFSGNRIMNVSPEYSDCVKLAKRSRVPLKAIYLEANRAAQDQLRKESR